MENPQIPSLYEWAGGMETFEKLTALFYGKVLKDELLEPIFRHMSPEHPKHVAHFIAEVFKGPETYTSTDSGSHYKMIQKHFQKHLTEAHRQRWVALLLQSADEIALPADPEFRSAFIAYIEWGTRIAVINSNVDEIPLHPKAPMPKWGWGEPGGPFLAEK
jgi:hemoglobin